MTRKGNDPPAYKDQVNSAHDNDLLPVERQRRTTDENTALGETTATTATTASTGTAGTNPPSIPQHNNIEGLDKGFLRHFEDLNFKDQFRASPFDVHHTRQQQQVRRQEEEDPVVATPIIVSAIPQGHGSENSSVIARRDDLADRVQRLEIGTTGGISRTLIIVVGLILVVIIVTTSVTVPTVIVLSRKSQNTPGPAVAMPGGKDTTMSPSQNPSSMAPTKRVTPAPSRLPTIHPTIRPTIDPDEAILASIDSSFIANLQQSDGRNVATNDTLAMIATVQDSITIPETTQRNLFTTMITGQWRDNGYYAVIINDDGLPKSGHDVAIPYTHCCIFGIVSTSYTLFVGTRDHPMMVRNQGEGGFENWGFTYFETDFWVRWGRLVLFVPDWNDELFGEPRTERDESEFPGWFF